MKKQISVVDATDAQLRAFAELNLGIFDIPASATRDVILAAIQRVDQSNRIEIEVKDGAPVDPGAAMARSTDVPRAWAAVPGVRGRMIVKGPSMQTDPHVLLLLTKTEAEGGDEPVPVGCNGPVVWLPRGELLEIPYRFYLVLAQAVKRVFRQIDEHGTMEGRDVPSYPMDVKALPTPDEIMAWHEKMQDEGKPKKRAAA